MLRVGVQPEEGDAEITVEHVAALDDGTGGVAHLGAATLDADRGLEPDGEPQVAGRLAEPPDHVLGGGGRRA